MVKRRLLHVLVLTCVLGTLSWSLAQEDEKPLRPGDTGVPKVGGQTVRTAEQFKAIFKMDELRPKLLEEYNEEEDQVVGPDGGQLVSFIAVTFEQNKAEIVPERSTELLAFAEAYRSSKATGVLNFRVEGHASSEGPAEFNDQLSRLRAEAVMAYLIAEGVASGALESVGKGNTEPVVENDVENRKKSRRVEIVRLWDDESE